MSAHLKKAWVTAVKDDGEGKPHRSFGTAPSTSRRRTTTFLALDGKNGALKWAFGYEPGYELQYAVDRGVRLSDGKLYRNQKIAAWSRLMQRPANRS